MSCNCKYSLNSDCSWEHIPFELEQPLDHHCIKHFLQCDLQKTSAYYYDRGLEVIKEYFKDHPEEALEI